MRAAGSGGLEVVDGVVLCRREGLGLVEDWAEDSRSRSRFAAVWKRATRAETWDVSETSGYIESTSCRLFGLRSVEEGDWGIRGASSELSGMDDSRCLGIARQGEAFASVTAQQRDGTYIVK